MSILTFFRRKKPAANPGTHNLLSYRVGQSVRPLPESLHPAPLYEARQDERGDWYVFRNHFKMAGPYSEANARERAQVFIDNIAKRHAAGGYL